MWNTYNHRDGDVHHHHTTKNVSVTEHKAPTDESIRLYMELEEKAAKGIIARYSVQDNLINFVAFVMQNPRASAIDTLQVWVRLSFNGRIEEFSEEINQLSVPLVYDNVNRRYDVNLGMTKMITDKIMPKIYTMISKGIYESITDKNKF